VTRAYGLLVAAALVSGVAVAAAIAGKSALVAAVMVVAVLLPLAHGLFRIISGAIRKLDVLDLFSPMVAFPLAYVVWFTLGTVDWIYDPIHVLYGMFDPMPAAIWGYVGLGLAGYLCGVLLVSRKGQRFPKPVHPSRFENQWNPSASRTLAVTLFGLVAVAYLALIARMGIPILSASAADDRLKIMALGPTHSLFLCSAWTLMTFLAAGSWTGRMSGWAAGIAVGLTSLLLLSLGGRTNFFVGLLTVLVCRNYLKRSVRFGTILLLVMVSFAAMSAYGFFRDVGAQGSESSWSLDELGVPGPIQPFIYSLTYVRGSVATFRDVSMIIPSEVPYQYGRLTLLPLATLLPGHHPLADAFFKDLLGHNFVGDGQPATPLGPLYCDFGAPGIFGGLFLFGVLAGKAYRALRERPEAGTVLVYAWIMQSGLFGLFSGLFPNITTLFVPLLWITLDWFLSLEPPQLRSRASFRHGT
jgi:oligosaccharide repeat unit polymerase